MLCLCFILQSAGPQKESKRQAKKNKKQLHQEQQQRYAHKQKQKHQQKLHTAKQKAGGGQGQESKVTGGDDENSGIVEEMDALAVTEDGKYK